MKVKYHSAITRYEGSFSSLSAFLLCPAPRESDSESMQCSANGTLCEEKDGFTLSYREEDGTPVRVEYKAGELKFSRGLTQSLFSLGKTTVFSHHMGYGSLECAAYTTRLETVKRDGKTLLMLTYIALLSGMAQKNTMMWKLG